MENRGEKNKIHKQLGCFHGMWAKENTVYLDIKIINNTVILSVTVIVILYLCVCEWLYLQKKNPHIIKQTKITNMKQTKKAFIVKHDKKIPVIASVGCCSNVYISAYLRSSIALKQVYYQGWKYHQPRLDAWDKCSGLVLWEDPEEWDGEGGGRGDQDGEYM